MRVSPTIRKSINLYGTEATLFSVTVGAEDSFGDATYTFSQTTLTVILQPMQMGTSDEDLFGPTGRQHQERRTGFVSADYTVVPGDELYSNDTAKRYRIRGVTDVTYHQELVYRRLLIEEMVAGGVTST